MRIFMAVFFLFKWITIPEKCNQFNSKIIKAVEGAQLRENFGSRTYLVIRSPGKL